MSTQRGWSVRAHACAWVVTCVIVAHARAQDPVSPEQATEAERQGDWSSAGELYVALAKQEPDKLQWVLDAARCLRTAGRFNDALDVLDGAKSRFENSADIAAMTASTYHVKAENLIAQGIRDLNVRFQFEEAARIAGESLRLHPGRRDLRLILARSHYQLGNMDDALAQAEEAVRRFPDHHGGWILLGDIAYRTFVGLNEQLREMKPGDPDYAATVTRAGEARNSATEAFERAIALNPERPGPFVQLGNILAWTGNTEQALVQYEKALKIDPRSRVDHSWIAKNSKPDRRVRMYAAANAAYLSRPDATAAHAAQLDWWQAYALYERKRYKKAYELFVRVIEANPEFLNSRCYAMLAAYWQGEHDLAEKQAARYAKEAPKHFADHVRYYTNQDETVGIIEYFSRRAYEAGRMDRARDLNHVLAKLLDTARHWNNYAFLCRETRRFEESLRAYETAIELAPDSPQLLNDAAVILQYHLPSDANRSRAREMYERAVQLAKKTLEDEDSTDADKAGARQALQDAMANLRKLAEKG